MSSNAMKNLGIAAAVAIGVGLVEGGRWPYFVIGALLAVVTYLMLLIGSSMSGEGIDVSPRHFAVAAGVATVLGGALALAMDNPVWWSVGAVLVGVAAPATGSLSGSSPERHGR